MLFSVVRMAIAAIVSILCGWRVSRSKIKRKNFLYVTSFILFIVLSFVLAFVPIEDLFLNFSSPEAAFFYAESERADIVIDGEKSSLVVFNDKDEENSYSYRIIKKNGDSWKVGTGCETKLVGHAIVQKGSPDRYIKVFVCKYRNSNDYYISVSDANGKQLDICDNRSSEFLQLVNYNNYLKTNYYKYFVYVNDFNSDYVLTIDGEDFYPFDNMNWFSEWF